ncbi:MAG: HAMP domain-containing histidine kinase [Akkermansiaceae bacterium]|nr:HAMP domain-containing histidine kinase [Armatimonadota bacterium]
MREIDSALYSLLLPLALVAAVIGAVLTEMALAPIRQLARVVGTIEPTDLSARLPEPGGNDAFDRLAKLMNALLGRLEGAFARQRRFTGAASHELRTPLAVIKSATSLLLENPESLTPLQHRALDRADQSADRANRLVTDLLTLARTENDSLPLRLASLDVAEIVRETISEAKTVHGDTTVPVVCDIAEETVLSTDPDHFRRLLQNLLSNALRHTTRGQITVAATISPGLFHLTVRDTGEGIAPEALSRLGEPFYRRDVSRAREQGGAGLGLSLCNGIVAALNGTINIESILDQGTIVTVTLPRVNDSSTSNR